MRTRHALLLATALATTVSACRDDDPTGPASSPTERRIFIDDFIAADFQAFGGSKLDAVQLDTEVKYRGSTSLRVTVPGQGDPSGGYAGGAFVAATGRNLSGYNALSFYARASSNIELDVAGLGNDNTGTSLYTAQRGGIALTTTWQKIVIPIPDPAKLTNEKGLFFFAEGAPSATGYTVWFDDVQFETLPVTNVRPAIPNITIATAVGGTRQIEGLVVTSAVAGGDVTVGAAPRYFSFTSSAPNVASVNADGLVTVLAAGTANITATMAGTAASGTVQVGASSAPTSAAPTPTYAAGNVISLFSNAYTNVTVNTWSADWDQADVADVQVAGNATKVYTNLDYAGIEFTSAQVNATTMTNFRMDIWTPDASAAPAEFKVKLVDFGADGAFGGGDDREHELIFTATSTPALTTGSWLTLDIPLSAFTGLTTRANLAQLIISGQGGIDTVFIDNILFYR
jgi:hypothetical protein